MKEHAAARREAAEWFVLIHDAVEPPAQMLQEWVQWLEASGENQQAFENIVQTWHDARPESTSVAAANPDDGYDGSVPVKRWRAAAGVKYREWGIGIASAAVLAICAGAFHLFGPDFISKGEFVTRTDEHRELHLSDGSSVTLGARSRLVVNFSPSVRELRLDEGEAFFAVRKDVRRPFTVMALNGAITAVGTAFNVRALDDHVIVTVVEGAVKVADARPIVRGQQMTYRKDEAASPSKVTRVDPQESSRWREGWLIYRQEPLRDVLADLARYTELQFKLDESAGDLQFTGVISKDRIAEWIAALPQVSPVSVESQGSWFTIKGISLTISAEP